jgi:hypothetical protein
MPDRVEAGSLMKWNMTPVIWFVVLELLCVTGFVVLLTMGQTVLAASVLLGPLQLLAWFALAGNGYATLVAFTALLPLAGARLIPLAYDRFAYMPGTVVLLCLLVFTSYSVATKPGSVRLRTSVWLPLLVFGIWTVVSGLNATTHGWGWKFLLLMTIVTVQVMILAYFFATVPCTLADVRTLLYTAMAATVFVAICVPFLQTASGGLGALGGKMVDTPFGDVNLNTIGYILGPAAAVALGMAVGTRRARTKSWLLVTVFICALVLVLTKSRGAWLGFGAAFLYLMVRRRSLTLVASGVAAGIVVVFSDMLRALFVSRAAATTAYDPSLLGRFFLWDFAWRIGKANWLFGVGMENFRYVKQLFGFPMSLKAGLDFNAHNIYLEMFADLGVVGLATFLWMLVGSFIRSSNAVKFDDASDLGLGLSAGIVAYAAHGFVDSIFFQQGVFALLGLLVGLTMSLGRLTAAPPSATQRPLLEQ